MYLKSLYLKNFRNYKEAEGHFSSSVNVFYGENAQGKTNLLEAVHLIATGRSFRTQSLSELIKEGESYFFIEADILKDQVAQKIQLSFDGVTKRLKIASNEYSSFTPLLGLLPIVLCTPYDTELISGSPQERRRFMNLHLAQSDPLYVHHAMRFAKALKQRNSLLKSKQLQSIECWEMEMAKSNEYITNARKKMLEELKPEDLAEEKLLLQLVLSSSKNYLKQLEKNRKKEMEIGATLTGSHRDDLSIFIDQRSAKQFASEGQKKTALSALKFAEWRRLSDQNRCAALLGFDDIDSSLDLLRQKIIKTKLKEFGQVFITSPTPFQVDGNSLTIKDGVIYL